MLHLAGGEAAALLSALMSRCETAIVCADNLRALTERAADLMDIIVEKRERVGKGGPDAYRSLVGRFMDLLQVSTLHRLLHDGHPATCLC